MTTMSTFNPSEHPRHRGGTPTGGRFAPKGRTAPQVTLTDSPDTTPGNGRFTVPAPTILDADSMYPVTVGAHHQPGQDVADTAKAIRADLKAATQDGWLPPEYGYKVSTARYAGGQSIHVTVTGMTDDEHFDVSRADGIPRLVPSDRANHVRGRVQQILDSRNRQSINSMLDYYNVDYHSGVTLQTETGASYDEDDRDDRATARAVKAAKKAGMSLDDVTATFHVPYVQRRAAERERRHQILERNQARLNGNEDGRA